MIRYIESDDFRGYDPYDALNSPSLKALSYNSKYLRILFTQVLKRLPLNFRPLIGIKKGLNPKGLSLFLWGYAKLYAVEKQQRYLTTISRLLNLLEDTKTRGHSGNGWGYNFDWQSRAFFLPKFTPTVVNSSFIGHALLDTWKYTGLEKARHMALPVADFILRDLHRLKKGDAICFSYTPLDRYFVHNANLLGASVLIRLFGETDNKEYRDVALAALSYSMNHQREDGSWYYAEKDGSHWIDSFHTGFNLQSIRYFLEASFCGQYRNKFSQGVDFYKDRFFLEDGTSKYYHDRTYPIDIHSAAQAVVFFAGMGEESRELTERILKWMIHTMQDPKGFFYFQKHRSYTNRIPYMRWSQGWAFHALTEYIFQRGHG
ncbi:delta-aminolevulinic acid dehydratase [Thermodesulfobacteriota bacterium]